MLARDVQKRIYLYKNRTGEPIGFPSDAEDGTEMYVEVENV